MLYFVFILVLQSSRRGREVALLLLSYKCLVTENVLWLFLAVPWVGLQSVTVIVPNHTHIIYNNAL